MRFLDDQINEIKDGDALLFSHEDKAEPSGFNKYVTGVKLCFYSENEGRYIPFDEISTDFNSPLDVQIVSDSEIIKDQNKKP